MDGLVVDDIPANVQRIDFNLLRFGETDDMQAVEAWARKRRNDGQTSNRHHKGVSPREGAATIRCRINVKHEAQTYNIVCNIGRCGVKDCGGFGREEMFKDKHEAEKERRMMRRRAVDSSFYFWTYRQALALALAFESGADFHKDRVSPCSTTQ